MAKASTWHLSLLVIAALGCVVALVAMGILLVRTDRPEVLSSGARLSKLLLPAKSGQELSMRLAMRLVDSGQFGEAKKVLEDLLAQDGQNPTLLNNLAFVLGELGEREAARKYLLTALQLSPHCSECLNNLGTLHQRDGKANEAIESFQKAAALDPNHPDPRINLAVLHEERGEWTAALDWYRQAESRVKDPKVKKWVTLRALWMAEISSGNSQRKIAGERK